MKLDLKRKADWQVRLNNFIIKSQNRKFRMGQFDCCIFAAGAVKAMTGVDGMKEFKKKYSSVDGSRQALKALGKGTLYATLRSKLGNPIPAAHATRGDIAYIPAGSVGGVHIGTRLGIIIGREAIFLSEGGYHRVNIRFVNKAFRIPF